MLPGEREPGPGQQQRQVPHERGVGSGRAHLGQVGRDPLVEVEQLVHLGGGEASAPAQRVEPGPLPVVRGHERVDVHGVTLAARVRRRPGAGRDPLVGASGAPEPLACPL